MSCIILKRKIKRLIRSVKKFKKRVSYTVFLSTDNDNIISEWIGSTSQWEEISYLATNVTTFFQNDFSGDLNSYYVDFGKGRQSSLVNAWKYFEGNMVQIVWHVLKIILETVTLPKWFTVAVSVIELSYAKVAWNDKKFESILKLFLKSCWNFVDHYF